MAFGKVLKNQSKGRKYICNNIIRDKGPKQGALEKSKVWRKGIVCNDRDLLKGDEESGEHTLLQLLS